MKNNAVVDTHVSWDNASHSRRPGPGELVPSPYALRIGEIDVLVVSDGCYRYQPSR